MENYCIYKITNLINKKIYIGFSNNFKRRMSEHRDLSKRSKQLIHKAILKYGIDNFSFDCIYTSEDKEHTYEVMEPLYIAAYNCHYKTGYGYNMDTGGKPDPTKYQSKETRLKITNSLKGRKHTEAHKEKNRLSSLGRKHTEETKKKISDSHKGVKPKWWDDPAKRAKAIEKYKINFQNRKEQISENNSRSYLISYKNGKIETIKNLSQFCKDRDYNHSCIYRVFTGKRQVHKDIIKVERL